MRVTFAAVNTPRSTLSWWQALFLLLLLLTPGCLQLQSDEEQEAFAEQKVLARHDELMAKMDQLYQLRQQLGQLPDTARTAAPRRALLAADAAMMDWMHQYRKPADTVQHARVMAYLATQQQQLDALATKMNNSIDSARALLPTPAAR